MSTRGITWGVVVACAAFVGLALLLFQPWNRRNDAAATPSGIPYSLGQCHTYAEPVGAAGYNELAQTLRDPMLVGADVGASAHAGDGRAIWVFGDTARLVGDTTGPVVRNSMLLSGPECRAIVIAPAGGPVIPDRSDGVGYWPMSVTTLYADGITTAYVTAERVQGSEQQFQFTNLGPAIATFQIPDGGVPYYQGTLDLGADDSVRSNVGWGAAVVDGHDGWWYVYGTSNPDQPMVFGWSVRVARVHPETFTDTSTWVYWTGIDWSNQVDLAIEVIRAEGGVSQTFSVVTHGGEWYALSKLDGDLGDYLAMWPAAHPWGDFTSPVKVGKVPNTSEPSILRYMPLAHPEANQAGPDQMVVSISRNSQDQDLLAKEPGLYRPFFVDIAFPPEPSDALVDVG
ncbi:unannotated protein [freshwater metagenome]|uniref:Unannotated protein n=1 Tax=freshwater metagenome TaxID=449393 RepID=A0A6J7HXA0_9ZZZZ